MKFYSADVCEQWLEREAPYGTGINQLFFKPRENGDAFLTWHVADISGKSFQHDEIRILDAIHGVEAKYSKLTPMLKNLKILQCPRPCAKTSNACANENFICYFSRSTQIPWCMTDYITGHELGHVVQYTLCPREVRGGKFKEYLELRGAEKGLCTNVFKRYDSDTGSNVYEDRIDFLYLHGTNEQRKKYRRWDMNPEEWFAEDFRWFFGVDQGDKFWGHPIPKPDEKVREFMMSL